MEDVKQKLAQLPLLEGLEPDEFNKIADRFAIEQYPAGTRILEEGYGGIKLYVLIEGKIKVYRNMGTHQILLTTLEPPETFGEISIIDGNPTSASVDAETDVICLTLSRDDFYELISAAWPLQAKVMKNLLKTLCQRLRTTTNQVQDYFAINKALCENESFRNFYKLFCT